MNVGHYHKKNPLPVREEDGYFLYLLILVLVSSAVNSSSGINRSNGSRICGSFYRCSFSRNC